MLKRLADLPFRATRTERAEMNILRLAYTREIPVEASFNRDTKWLVDYRLVGQNSNNQERLESLATKGLLKRRHFTRSHTCLRCTSARLFAYEACPQCGGADLADERIVHHYRCGAQEAESHFIRGRRLVCPKCRRDLKHFGMDYGKSGVIVHCRSCGSSHGEPDPYFICLDCSAQIPAGKAFQNDWYHYDLTEAGITALRDGKLPSVQMGNDSDKRALREFILLASAAVHSANRFGRAFTVAELSTDVRPGGVRDEAMRQALGTAIEMLPPGNFAAAAGRSILLGFPETSSADATAFVNTLLSAIEQRTRLPLGLATAIHEGDHIAEWLRKFQS
jgi:hypothetical protein